jgi:peptidylprolyl isomerase
MSIKKGEFILMNMTCKVKESGEIVETTLEKTAKESGLHREGTTYEPRFVIVGEGWVPQGLDEGLLNMEVGQPNTTEIPPEKGYGPRDPSKMRLVPLRRFRTEGITPLPGMNVQLEGKSATVRSVGAGRVQLDYNHPLSGKTLIYDLTVEKRLESFEEKTKAILHRVITVVEPEKFTTRLVEKELTVEIPEEGFFLEGLQVLKQAVAADVLKFFPEVDKVSFVEVIKRKEPAAAEKPTEEKAAENSTEHK